MLKPTEDDVDYVARKAWSVLCKTDGPLTLREYASREIMEQQHERARVYLEAYLNIPEGWTK